MSFKSNLSTLFGRAIKKLQNDDYFNFEENKYSGSGYWLSKLAQAISVFCELLYFCCYSEAALLVVPVAVQKGDEGVVIVGGREISSYQAFQESVKRCVRYVPSVMSVICVMCVG